MMDYEEFLPQIFFDRNFATKASKYAATHAGTRINSNSDSKNQKLAKELHKAILRKFEIRYIYPVRTRFGNTVTNQDESRDF